MRIGELFFHLPSQTPKMPGLFGKFFTLHSFYASAAHPMGCQRHFQGGHKPGIPRDFSERGKLQAAYSAVLLKMTARWITPTPLESRKLHKKRGFQL